MLNRLAAFLDQQDRVLLTTHENPDGDGVGAMLGLAHLLRFMGKDVRIVISPELPLFLDFLDPEGWVETFDPEVRHKDLGEWPSVWMLVDASEPRRLGKMHPAFAASKVMKICLDHHLKDAPEGFDMEFTDATASASAQLVHGLASLRMSRPLPKPMATALYAGMVDDTGNFRFSNATPSIHRIAADLIEDGVEPARVYQQLYHQGRMERMKLMARAFDGLSLQSKGRYARITLSRSDLDACGAIHDDMEGLVNKPLELQGVEVSALLYEMEDGRIKASIRSRERVDVNAVCRIFGGGGHRLASGAKLDGPLSMAQNRIDEAVQAQLWKDMPEA